MQPRIIRPSFLAISDIGILCFIATLIYGVVELANAGSAVFNPVTQIDLSAWSLPFYTLLSGMRGLVAYIISLGFTLIVGYIAAKSKTAERIIIPSLDILQSIPVLGFLPGLLLGLVALFPNSNFGIELT